MISVEHFTNFKSASKPIGCGNCNTATPMCSIVMVLSEQIAERCNQPPSVNLLNYFVKVVFVTNVLK